jgi:hypothetical protein
MLTLDEEKRKYVITHLEYGVKPRAFMYIGKLNAELMESYLFAFNSGCLVMLGEEQREGGESFSRRMTDLRLQYQYERGWPGGCGGQVEGLRKQGLCEIKIIEGLIEIEIKIWKNL